MKKRIERVIPLLVLALIIGVVVACAPAATPTPVPTPVPTKAAPPTAAPQPTATPAVSPTSAPATKPPAVAVPTLAGSVPKSVEQIQRIKPEELKKLMDGGADIVVVDNQPKGAYDLGHIKGAVNFPWDMEIKSAGNLPRDKLLILYCACTHEEDASDVAMQLITNFGYTKIMLLDGGWLKWVELGYPQEKGAK